MDKKLTEYRSQKKRKEFINASKELLISFFHRGVGKYFPFSAMDEKCSKREKEESEIEIDESDTSSTSMDSIENACGDRTYQKIILYGSLWLILFSLAIYLEFGAVYFVISSLYIIWKNTRTGPKKKGEISAYSVFNPNCEPIDGTLDAKQFEKELLYGAL